MTNETAPAASAASFTAVAQAHLIESDNAAFAATVALILGRAAYIGRWNADEKAPNRADDYDDAARKLQGSKTRVYRAARLAKLGMIKLAKTHKATLVSASLEDTPTALAMVTTALAGDDVTTLATLEAWCDGKKADGTDKASATPESRLLAFIKKDDNVSSLSNEAIKAVIVALSNEASRRVAEADKARAAEAERVKAEAAA